MQVTGIKSGGNYDPFLVDALGIGKTKSSAISEDKEKTQPVGWQRDILISALDKLEKNVKVEDNSPLNYNTAAPLENFQDALQELHNLINNNFEKYAAKAQANLNPMDVLYLFEEEQNFII